MNVSREKFVMLHNIMDKEARFHWADYVAFGVTLLLSAFIGIYFAYVERHKKGSTEEFLMAGRRMSPVLVALSLFVTWMSSIAFLGDPVQAYTFGAIYWILGLGYTLGIPLVAHFFAPYFHKLKIVSAYEIIETRYNKALRIIATIANIIIILLWLGIVLYGPALALSLSSGIPVWVAMVCIALVCIFYTSIGGMKAVLWTDALQMGIMLAGQLAVVIQGCLRVGGVKKLFSIVSKTGHSKIDNFDPNPFSRASFWAFLFGGMFRTIVLYSSSQMLVQRYGTVKTKNEAKIAAYLTIPVNILMVTLFTATGLVMAAVYAGCDPLKQGRIEHKDQMVPLFVLDLLGSVPGIPGLFMACVFSASLSTVSSGINAMSANTLKDFIEPAVSFCMKKKLDDRIGTIIAKCLVIVFGGIILGLGFLMRYTEGTIFILQARVRGMMASPLGGLFLVAVLLPKIKSKSVTVAFFLTLAFLLWVGIGSFFLPMRVSSQALPSTAEFCEAVNSTSYNTSRITTTTMTALTTEQFHTFKRFSLDELYYLDPLYYSVVGSMGVVILSVIFHLFGLCWDRCHKNEKDPAKETNKTDLEVEQEAAEEAEEATEEEAQEEAKEEAKEKAKEEGQEDDQEEDQNEDRTEDQEENRREDQTEVDLSSTEHGNNLNMQNRADNV